MGLKSLLMLSQAVALKKVHLDKMKLANLSFQMSAY